MLECRIFIVYDNQRIYIGNKQKQNDFGFTEILQSW